MDEWQLLRQTALRFESEVERVVNGNWVSMPMPLVILIDALESEPVLRSHLDECVTALEPDGFDAEVDLDRVAEVAGSRLGPFEADDRLDFARAYLLTRALVERGCKYDDPLFASYGPDAPRHQEHFDRFVADVVTPLIEGALAELARRREALGPCPYEEEVDASDPTEPQAEEMPAKEVTPELLASLVDALEASVASLPARDQQDVRLQIEALRDELFCAQPKQRVATALIRVLRMLGGSAEFIQALDPLEKAVASMA